MHAPSGPCTSKETFVGALPRGRWLRRKAVPGRPGQSRVTDLAQMDWMRLPCPVGSCRRPSRAAVPTRAWMLTMRRRCNAAVAPRATRPAVSRPARDSRRQPSSCCPWRPTPRGSWPAVSLSLPVPSLRSARCLGTVAPWARRAARAERCIRAAALCGENAAEAQGPWQPPDSVRNECSSGRLFSHREPRPLSPPGRLAQRAQMQLEPVRPRPVGSARPCRLGFRDPVRLAVCIRAARLAEGVLGSSRPKPEAFAE